MGAIMKEKAKEIFNQLKEKNEELNDSFNAYVDSLTENLEIPREIAVTLVTEELVNANQKKLILHGLFSKWTLEENNVK